MLNFDNAQLFYVLDYKGEVNLCYTSIQANYCSLYHALLVDSVSSDMNTVFNIGNLYPTICESEPGVKVTEPKSNVGESQPMLALAVKSNFDTDRNSKVWRNVFTYCLFFSLQFLVLLFSLNL